MSDGREIAEFIWMIVKPYVIAAVIACVILAIAVVAVVGMVSYEAGRRKANDSQEHPVESPLNDPVSIPTIFN